MTRSQSAQALRSRADARLLAFRAALAQRLEGHRTEHGIAYTRAAHEMGCDKNMVFRLLQPEDPDYAQPTIEPVWVALEWLGLTAGDIAPERPQVCRKLTLADAHLAFADLGLSASATKVLCRVVDETFAALSAMEDR